jgi:DNA-binding transcriptional LysR family regulator/transcription elongation GreA/GreB family factor
MPAVFCYAALRMRASPDDILGMAFFARVVEARSFSAAARALGVSKSAVSARVARLEKRLGVGLLHRTTRKLALTADGVRLYERCARVVAEADEAADIAAGASEVPRGTLRVSAPAGFARGHLTHAIGAFMRAHPSVRIDLRLSDRVPERIVEELDVALVIAGRLADSNLTVRKLASIRIAVCAAPEYLRRRGIPFRPQDLVLHDVLTHSGGQTHDLRFSTDEGAVSMTSLAHLAADDSRFLQEAALAGLGIAALPEPVVREDLLAGRLYRILDDFQTMEVALHAMHPHGRLPPASVRAFLDHVAVYFREPPSDGTAASPTPPRRRAKKDNPIVMTEQDVRRLNAVAALYAEVDAISVEKLRDALDHPKTLPVAKIPRTLVTINSRLHAVDDAGRDHELSLVYPWDAGRDRVSLLSPLGLELLGSSVGAKVHDGKRTLTIRALPYQPEAAGDHHL